MSYSLRLFDEHRRPASYTRQHLKGDVLYSSYRYKQLCITFGLSARVEDGFTAQLVRDGLITAQQKAACDQRIQAKFATKELAEAFDSWSVEGIGRHIHQLRHEVLGTDVLIRAQEAAVQAAAPFEITDGVDQRDMKKTLLTRTQAVIFALNDASLVPLMRADIAQALALGKSVYVVCSACSGDEVPTQAQFTAWLAENKAIHYLRLSPNGIEMDAALQQHIDLNTASLFFYGEDGLLFCRSLRVDALVQSAPQGFYAQALVNSLGITRPCAVYVPAHFDITPYAPLRERARLTYWHLWQLCRDFGPFIYQLSVEELYRRYPQYFINMYQSGARCAEAQSGCPLRVTLPDEGNAFAQHDLQREEAVSRYLNGFDGFGFAACYFDAACAPAPLPYTSDAPDGGILVHTVRVRSARNAGVISRPENVPLRCMFTPQQTGVLSNFLFFMTPKLAVLYNDLRSDRSYEQADVTAGHLDYLLCYENGVRKETFPLFRKMCMAIKENGEFLFFNFQLGGGSITAGNHIYRWAQNAVNAEGGPVCVYTPQLSCPDEDADRQTYRKLVGAGRVNLVILQDRIHCIRRGDVVLPSVGVVVSLSEETANDLLQQLSPLENGYYDAAGLKLQVHLDAPQGIDESTWQQVRWAYGGGLTLMQNGESLDESDDMIAWFAREGWMSPLSRQTQESALHTLSKHPRTAIGRTKGGDMVLLVYSGRTRLSSGADYVEMCRIARQIYPDMDCLMNVDGGASAVLCLVRNGVMMELNCPSTSSASCAGMARPIKTLLYIPIDAAHE